MPEITSRLPTVLAGRYASERELGEGGWGELMISELRIQNGELRIPHATPHSQLTILNSKFMLITSRLSTALADRYRIERHLGEGEMATVYLAEDLFTPLARP